MSTSQLPSHYRAVRQRLMDGRTPSLRPRQGGGARRAETVYTLGFVHGLVLAMILGANDLEPSRPPAPLQLDAILDAACRFYGACPIDVKSQRKTAKVVMVRQIAIYLMCKLTRKTLLAIGEFVGGRDHTTVLHARRKIASRIAIDSNLAGEIELLEQILVANHRVDPSAGG